ncbi:hypothetical protein BC834DRAFT_852303 [Gloeopeniophorella convolvens]|nr:hypothetical protein BC834DRAFT_852303 [Gloeopeniophorella convolvens]
MTRVLLGCSSLVVFDETTNSIDFAPDAEFRSIIVHHAMPALVCLSYTSVAHRLKTSIIGYDKVIVLNKG